MKKIGLSCKNVLKRYGIDKGFEMIKRSGFDAIDFSVEENKLGDEIYGSQDAFETYFYNVKRKAEEYELEVSQAHGRCSTFVPDDDDANERFLKICDLDFKAAAMVGAPSCVVHFINSTRWGKQPADVMRKTSAVMYDRLIPMAEKYGINIALETFGAARISGDRIRDFFADPCEFKMQFDRLNTKNKTICVDTGHIHEAESFWVPPPEEYIRYLGKDITLLHLHDNNGRYDDHLVPGMGNINWPAVFDALDEVGYKGVYSFELNLKFGFLIEEFVQFAGRYLRAFVDANGNLKQ